MEKWFQDLRSSTNMPLFIPDSDHLDATTHSIQQDGVDTVHILTDFDRTLTYGSLDGIKTATIVSLLRDGHHLREDYADRAHALFDQYHPLEIDPTLSVEDKKPIMTEWWQKHFNLMIECKLKHSDIEDAIENSHLRFRAGVPEFLIQCAESNIPVVIISASACGEAIQIFFKKHGVDFPNISYVCNQFEWHEDGTARAVRDPIIHVFNKDETVLEMLPEVFKKIQHRTNVVLLGDSLGDLGMSTGFAWKNLLKIGFLNVPNTNMREQFAHNFDIVVEGDADFSEVGIYLQPLLS